MQVLFITKNKRSFENFRKAMQPVSVHRAEFFKEINYELSNFDYQAIVFHITEDSGWTLAQMVRAKYPDINCYTMLSPAMLKKLDDGEKLAGQKNSITIYAEDGLNNLVTIIKTYLPGTLDDLTAEGFINAAFLWRMKNELTVNQNVDHKGDWRKWKPEKLYLVSEINWHFAKFIQALNDGNKAKISEYSADVANYMMKADSEYGIGDELQQDMSEIVKKDRARRGRAIITTHSPSDLNLVEAE